jgi:hypothetical protein
MTPTLGEGSTQQRLQLQLIHLADLEKPEKIKCRRRTSNTCEKECLGFLGRLREQWNVMEGLAVFERTSVPDEISPLLTS